MKYLVTGGAGFIGSHLCEALIEKENEVVTVDDLSAGYESNLVHNNNLRLIVEKIQSVSEEQLEGIDGIFHLAAQASVPVSIEEFYSSTNNNLQSSVRVFDLARKRNIPVVYASSSAIYGNLPVGDDRIEKYEILSPYAQDKLTMEHYARLCHNLYGISSVGLRFFNVYGPRQDPKSPYSGVISIFMDRFMNKKEVIINGGYQTRDFIYVKDIVHTILTAMHLLMNEKKCMFLNVGTGISVTINELYEKMVSIFNYRPEIEYRPLDKADPERSDGIFERLREELMVNFKAFTKLQQGLHETVNYYLNN